MHFDNEPPLFWVQARPFSRKVGGLAGDALHTVRSFERTYVDGLRRIVGAALGRQPEGGQSGGARCTLVQSVKWASPWCDSEGALRTDDPSDRVAGFVLNGFASRRQHAPRVESGEAVGVGSADHGDGCPGAPREAVDCARHGTGRWG